MIILAYNDRFEPFSKYLRQFVMESFSSEKDLAENIFILEFASSATKYK